MGIREGGGEVTEQQKVIDYYKKLAIRRGDEWKQAVVKEFEVLRADAYLAGYPDDVLGSVAFPRMEALCGIDPESCEMCAGTRVFCGAPCDKCEHGDE